MKALLSVIVALCVGFIGIVLFSGCATQNARVHTKTVVVKKHPTHSHARPAHRHIRHHH